MFPIIIHSHKLFTRRLHVSSGLNKQFFNNWNLQTKNLKRKAPILSTSYDIQSYVEKQKQNYGGLLEKDMKLILDSTLKYDLVNKNVAGYILSLCGNKILDMNELKKDELFKHLWKKFEHVKYDTDHYNLMLEISAQNDIPIKIEKILSQMDEENIEANDDTLYLIFKLSCLSGNLDQANRYIKTMQENKTPLKPALLEYVIIGNCIAGEDEIALEILNKALVSVSNASDIEKTSRLYSALCMGYSLTGNYKKMEDLLKNEEGFYLEYSSPNLVNSVVNIAKKHGDSIAMNFVPYLKSLSPTAIFSILVKFSQCGAFDSGLSLLEEMDPVMRTNIPSLDNILLYYGSFVVQKYFLNDSDKFIKYSNLLVENAHIPIKKNLNSYIFRKCFIEEMFNPHIKNTLDVSAFRSDVTFLPQKFQNLIIRNMHGKDLSKKIHNLNLIKKHELYSLFNKNNQEKIDFASVLADLTDECKNLLLKDFKRVKDPDVNVRIFMELINNQYPDKDENYKLKMAKSFFWQLSSSADSFFPYVEAIFKEFGVKPENVNSELLNCIDWGSLSMESSFSCLTHLIKEKNVDLLMRILSSLKTNTHLEPLLWQVVLGECLLHLSPEACQKVALVLEENYVLDETIKKDFFYVWLKCQNEEKLLEVLENTSFSFNVGHLLAYKKCDKVLEKYLEKFKETDDFMWNKYTALLKGNRLDEASSIVKNNTIILNEKPIQSLVKNLGNLQMYKRFVLDFLNALPINVHNNFLAFCCTVDAFDVLQEMIKVYQKSNIEDELDTKIKINVFEKLFSNGYESHYEDHYLPASVKKFRLHAANLKEYDIEKLFQEIEQMDNLSKAYIKHSILDVVLIYAGLSNLDDNITKLSKLIPTYEPWSRSLFVHTLVNVLSENRDIDRILDYSKKFENLSPKMKHLVHEKGIDLISNLSYKVADFIRNNDLTIKSYKNQFGSSGIPVETISLFLKCEDLDTLEKIKKFSLEQLQENDFTSFGNFIRASILLKKKLNFEDEIKKVQNLEFHISKALCLFIKHNNAKHYDRCLNILDDLKMSHYAVTNEYIRHCSGTLDNENKANKIRKKFECFDRMHQSTPPFYSGNLKDEKFVKSFYDMRKIRNYLLMQDVTLAKILD